jgi:hypothetical protein
VHRKGYALKLRTWQFENAVVILVLAGVWLATGRKPVEPLGSAAVFAGFCHASIAERMREREAQRAKPAVECYRLSTVFFLLKEAGWLAYFLIQGAWSALVGCALFALYPLWRRLWRFWYPLPKEG